jgi:hypothetical protein
MIPIVDADEELLGTLIAAARFGRAGVITDRLRARYDEEWDDPLAGFPYALAMFSLLLSGREDFLEQFNYTEIIETLSDLLYHEPDHWLGRYLRIHTRTLLPADGEHRQYLAAERAKAAADASELIERQSRAAWQPWFACSYLMAARLEWQSDRQDRDQVATLVRAATARPRAPVRFRALGGVLRIAFVWYCDQPELPERDQVRATMDNLFPTYATARPRERAGDAA